MRLLPALVTATLGITLALLTTLAAGPAGAHGDQAHPLLLVNGSWLENGRFVRRDFYSVEGRLLAKWSGAVDDTVDLAGGFVVPPFADAHSHLLGDTSSFERDQRRFLAAGIFYSANPNHPASQAGLARARAGQPRGVDVIYANGGLTSPGGHPAQIYDPPGAPVRGAGDAYVEVADAAVLDRLWPQLLADRPDVIKVYLESSEAHQARRDDPAFRGRRGLDPRLLPRVVALARRAGLRVWCHATSAADFRTAVAAGVDQIAHLPLAAIDEADARAAARAKITVVTTVVSHRAPESAELDSLHARNLRVLRRAGVTLALGTDHPGFTVLDEAERIRRLGALDDAALLGLLTRGTARQIFPDRRVGVLEPGAEASFLVLEGDPLGDFANLRRIRLRMKQGRLVEVAAEKPSVAEAMLPALMRGDVPAAVALYDRLKRDEPERHDFREPALNQIGYRLLQHGQAAAAVTLFLKNLEAFPDSPNGYDSLADGYLAAGDTTRAVGAYQKVLAALAARPQGNAEFRQKLETRAREQIGRLKPARP